MANCDCAMRSKARGVLLGYPDIEGVTTLALLVISTFVMQNNKKTKKPLSLHQETLRVMTHAELAVVAGGGTGTSDNTAGKVTSAACGG